MTRRAFLRRTAKLLLVPLGVVIALIVAFSVGSGSREISLPWVGILIVIAAAGLLAAVVPPMAAGAVAALLFGRRRRLAATVAGGAAGAATALVSVFNQPFRAVLASHPMHFCSGLLCVAFWAYFGNLGGEFVAQYELGTSGSPSRTTPS